MAKILIATLIACLSTLASAEVRFSGFGNIGLLASDSDNLAYRNNISQSYGTFSEKLNFRTNTKLGLQFEWNNDADFDAVIQGILQETHDNSATDYIRLAFLRYRPNANFDIRIGRVPLDLFLLTEYRDVDFAYPWAKVPNSVYGTIPYFYVDGLDASYTHQFQDFSLISKAYIGSSSANIGDLNASQEIDLSTIMGLSFELQSFEWLVSAKFSHGSFSDSTAGYPNLVNGLNTLQPIWPSVDEFSQQFEMKDVVAYYGSIGGRYDLNDFTFHAELTNVSSDSIAVSNLTSGYVSVAYRLDDKQYYVSLGQTDSKRYRFREYEKNGIDITQFPADMQMSMIGLQQLVEYTANYFASNQTTLSVGSRWNISDNVALKLQLDNTHVEQDSATLWLKPPGVIATEEETITTLFFNVSFIF